MIKLADLLKETLEEANIVQVPEEVLSKLEGVYNYAKKYEDKLKEAAPEDYYDPYIPSTYNKYLKFQDLKGEPIAVSIGFYNNPNDTGAGRMDTNTDTMLINMAFFGDKENFLEVGEHELVHAMDPKVRDVKIFGKMYPKKGAEPDKDVDKYYKSPWEFDAFTTPLINKLKVNLSKEGADKSININNLVQMFSDLRTRSVEDVSWDEKYYLPLAPLFSKKEYSDEVWPSIFKEFVNDLTKVKAWIGKPTLYKKFLQRLYTNVK